VRQGLPFGVWMALAKATPVAASDEEPQSMLGAGAPQQPGDDEHREAA
jgi:hypothetical protein